MTVSETPIAVTDYGIVLDAISAQIRSTGLFKSAARIEPAPGPLTEAWLKANSLPHGGALVSLAGVGAIKRYSNGLHRHSLQLGIYFIPEPAARTRQARDLARDVSTIIGDISLNRFGLSGATVPSKLRAANRYSATLDQKGSTLWTIDWSQDVLLADQDNAVVRLDLAVGNEDSADVA